MGISLEQALKRCDFRGGACAPPFGAVGRLSAPFNASSASGKMLSIRRRGGKVLGGLLFRRGFN